MQTSTCCNFMILTGKFPVRIYTERDSKIGFGLARKLPRLNHYKQVNISNMNLFIMTSTPGLWRSPNSIFELRSVYIKRDSRITFGIKTNFYKKG